MSASPLPLKPVAPETLASVRATYEADGAAIVKNVVSKEWLKQLAEGTELLLSGDAAHNFSRPGEGYFFGSLFTYLNIPQYHAFLMESGIGRIAADLMGSKTARFFYDQPLIKEPGTPKPTPWHQDAAYWPVSGRQIISIWVPLDPATTENGVVAYVKGSHKWKAYYPSVNWSDNMDQSAELKPGDTGLVEVPGPGQSEKQPRTIADIRDNPENYEFTDFSVEPGDVLIHQMETVHGAPGNMSSNMRRRAIAFRFVGDDARWDDTHPHFMRMMKRTFPDFPHPKLETGDPFNDPLFPLLWDENA